VAHGVGDAEGVALSIGNLAMRALNRKDWPEAETLANEALALAEKLGGQELIAVLCDYLARALLRQGKSGEAVPPARRAVDIFTRLGSHRLEFARKTLEECEA
jgi:hypothetical protein